MEVEDDGVDHLGAELPRFHIFSNMKYIKLGVEAPSEPQVIPPDSMMQRRAAGMRYFLSNSLLKMRNCEELHLLWLYCMDGGVDHLCAELPPKHTFSFPR